jgi:hypothetical protein
LYHAHPVACHKQHLRWRRQAGALAIIISFLGGASPSKLIAGVNMPKIGVSQWAFEHIPILNAPKNIYSGSSAVDFSALFGGDRERIVPMKAKAWSHGAYEDGWPDVQICRGGEVGNFNVIRKCYVIAWRLAEILKSRCNARDSGKLKHFYIRWEDISPQLSLGGLFGTSYEPSSGPPQSESGEEKEKGNTSQKRIGDFKVYIRREEARTRFLVRFPPRLCFGLSY